jgi:hypothetical protein
VADLCRCSSRLAGGLRRSGPRCVSGLHRTELDRYTAEESARQAGQGRRLINKPPDIEGAPMELDDRALPLTPGRFGTDWQLGLFVRIEGPVERDPLEWAIRRVMREAEPVRAAFFEEDGQVSQRAIDYSDVELAFYDLSGSHLQHPTFRPCRQWSKTRWLDQAVPTSKSSSNTLTEPPDEKRVSGRG